MLITGLLKKLRDLLQIPQDLGNPPNYKENGSKRKPARISQMTLKDPVLSKLRELWDTTEIKDEKWQKAQKIVAQKIKKSQFRYEEVETLVWDQYGKMIPWPVIASIHALEAGLDFSKNLHNGQDWDQKTTWVPKGRGPFNSWEEAALDAFGLKKDKFPDDWTISKTLDFLERYNGLGYRKYRPNVNSPYLWSGTNHYTKGKYVSDGKFDKNAVSKQLGAVLILKSLYYNGRSSQE